MMASALVAVVGLLLPATRMRSRPTVACAVAGGDVDVSVRLVTLQCPPDLSASALSDALIESGALYVSLSDGSAGTEEEMPIFSSFDQEGSETLESWDELLEARRLWRNATLEVGFAPSADVSRAMLSVISDAGQAAPPKYSVDDIAPRDWVTDVQANWPPVLLPGLVIRFPWHTASDVDALSEGGAAAAVPEAVVTLHPGMAFGTGEHQTTQLCCIALQSLLGSAGPLQGCSVLDYGSGSGILSFAALKFGASRAVGVEIDVEALQTSCLNAVENGLPVGTFEPMLPDEEAARAETYPLVVANILAHTLIELADVLAARVAPNGHILMSGVWGDDQVERVVKAYAGRGLSEIDVTYAEGGWALLQATRVEPDTGLDTQPTRGVTARAATSTPPPQGFVWGAQEVY